MRRKQVLSAASKILARGASSSPPPSQCLCLRMTPTTLTRNTMSTLYSAQSGRALALALQGRPPRLDRSKVNLAWFLSAILSSPPPPFSLFPSTSFFSSASTPLSFTLALSLWSASSCLLSPLCRAHSDRSVSCGGGFCFCMLFMASHLDFAQLLCHEVKWHVRSCF